MALVVLGVVAGKMPSAAPKVEVAAERQIVARSDAVLILLICFLKKRSGELYLASRLVGNYLRPNVTCPAYRRSAAAQSVILQASHRRRKSWGKFSATLSAPLPTPASSPDSPSLKWTR